jgi:hypothetical protein
MTYENIDSLLVRMRADLTTLQARRDARRFFHATYLRTTRAVADEIEHGGFVDPGWVRHWDLVFAGLYWGRSRRRPASTGSCAPPTARRAGGSWPKPAARCGATPPGCST